MPITVARNADEFRQISEERVLSEWLVTKDRRSTGGPSVRSGRELGEFLHAKRAALKPSDLGLPTIGRRRVIGLRREELASAATIGVTWYTWLEQGRDIRVSSEMLGRIARVLRLSPSDTAYLFALAGQPEPEIRESIPRLDETIKAMLDGYTGGPAYVLDESFDVQEFNHPADLVYRFDAYDSPRRRNMLWRNFIDPYRRQLYLPWLENVTTAVGFLRSVYAKRRGEPKLEQLVKDLCEASLEFGRLWDDSRRRGPSSYAPGELRLHVPQVGFLTFLSVTLTIVTYPTWLVVFLSPVDDATASAMNRLTSCDR